MTPPDQHREVIDNAFWHTQSGVGDDPDASASWHIVTFLLWAAQKGLLAPHVLVEKLRRDPVEYLYDEMGGKLLVDDLLPEAATFARDSWEEYGCELADLCDTHDIETAYHVYQHSNADEIRGWMFETLDSMYAAGRAACD